MRWPWTKKGDKYDVLFRQSDWIQAIDDRQVHLVFRGNNEKEVVREIEACLLRIRGYWHGDEKFIVHEVMIRSPQGDISKFKVNHANFLTLERAS